MTSRDGTCRACGAAMLWAEMPSGRANPLNVEEVEPEVGKGVVAFNRDSGRGMPVTFANIEQCAKWAEKGITFHTSHFATCRYRGRFGRTAPEPPTTSDEQQEQLLR